MNCKELSFDLSPRVIATFAKHMVCPANLTKVELEENLPRLGRTEFEKYRYRMQSNNYSINDNASCNALLEKLCAAVNSEQSQKKPLLLLSDGKDSMALALAYSQLGKSIDTLTFLRRNDHELKKFIIETCGTIGHQPHFIEVDDILKNFDKDVFISACSKMTTPVLDQGFLFFLFGLNSFFSDNALNAEDFVIIDGLGNDETFGYLPSKKQIQSYRLAKLGLWKVLPPSLKSFKWFIRSPAESHGDLSALACFFPIKSSYDLNNYFSDIQLKGDKLSFVDFRAFSRGAFHDHQCMMGKTKASAKFHGVEVFFPWLHSDLANYVFNLPEHEKFNFESLQNKVLLRKLLSKKINWQQSKRGVDLYFDLDLATFKSRILGKVVPEKMISIIDNNFILPDYVKQRAYLELLNLYGFCISNGMSEVDIEELLLR